MNSDYEQIKMILLGLTDVSDSQYNRLIDVYGEDIVIDTIKDLYNEDNSILLKLGKYVSNLYLNITEGMKDAYHYYIDDIDLIKDMNSSDKKKLLDETIFLVKKLNKLFDKIDGIDGLRNDRNVPWISDKVEYCISVCSDKDLLDKIKSLYNEYIEKRNVLLEAYLKFVIKIAKNFLRDGGISVEDLIQNGNVGLMRAIEMYNPDKDTDFLTYAGYWIKQGIIYNSKKMLCNFKYPIRMYDFNIKRVRTVEYLTSELGRIPTNREVADYLDVDMSKLDEVILLFNESISSEDLMLDSDDMDNYCEVIDNSVDLDKNMIYDEMSLELRKLMDICLTEREKDILESRYGFSDEISVPELSKMYGVSEQRIYQITQGAFRKLYKNKEFKRMKVYLR